MKIELTYPTPPEQVAAWRTLAMYGLTTPTDVLRVATYGSTDNPLKVLVAAGQLAMTMQCRSCGERRLDVSNKDALGLELCPECLTEAELENEHSDYGHDTPVEGCPSCKEEA